MIETKSEIKKSNDFCGKLPSSQSAAVDPKVRIFLYEVLSETKDNLTNLPFL